MKNHLQSCSTLTDRKKQARWLGAWTVQWQAEVQRHLFVILLKYVKISWHLSACFASHWRDTTPSDCISDVNGMTQTNLDTMRNGGVRERERQRAETEAKQLGKWGRWWESARFILFPASSVMRAVIRNEALGTGCKAIIGCLSPANFSGQIINAWITLLEPHCGGKKQWELWGASVTR